MAKESKSQGATVVLNLGAKASEDKMNKKPAPMPEKAEAECKTCPHCGEQLS